MWILRFHLLTSKDYNKVTRICKKYGFSTRKYSAIIYAKGIVIHETQNKSWRLIGQELGVSHIGLYKFSELAHKSECLSEIFHVFIKARIALYVGNTRHIEMQVLDNSDEILELTLKQLERIVKG